MLLKASYGDLLYQGNCFGEMKFTHLKVAIVEKPCSRVW